MLICRQCGHRNQPDAVICAKCADTLAISCANCFRTVPANSKYCNFCGSSISAPDQLTTRETAADSETLTTPLTRLMPRQLEEKIDFVIASLRGERRLVTILRLHLMSTKVAKLGADLEAEFLLLQQMMQALVAIIYDFEGHLDYLAHDGLQAFFGAPVTHENDPERALRAALDVLAQVREYEPAWQELGEQVQVRMGVHTGKVIVGRVSERWKMDYSIIGDTLNVVQGLVERAPWGEVLVSDMTYQYTQPLFRFRQLDTVSADGGISSVAYLLQELRQRPRGRERAGAQNLLPMVGREEALREILEIFTEVEESQKPQVVLVSGEAGIGKSRLVWEFRSKISGQEGLKTAVTEGHGLSYARARPYWVILDILRNLLGISEREPTPAQLTILREYLQQLGLWQEEVWPYIANLLGIKPEMESSDPPVRVTDAAMLQRLTHAALRRVFLAQAALSPLVIVIEDSQWIDTASWEFFRQFIQSVGIVQLLLIFVAREEINGILEALQVTLQPTDLPFTHLPLLPLTQSENLRLVEVLFQTATPELQSLKGKVVELAGGNPFFTEEIIRTLRDEGGLIQENGEWRATNQAAALLTQAPATLGGLVLARFDKLAAPVQETLQKAAVLGLAFPVSLLAHIHQLKHQELAAHLEELERRLFLQPRLIGDEPGFAFRHALVQEIVYETLLQREQQQLHAKTALAIELDRSWPWDEKVELLAYHFARSTHKDQALMYLLEAAEHAARRYANETAVHYYRQILSLIDVQPASFDSHYFRARIGLGQSLKLLGQYQEAQEILASSLQDFLRWSIVAESSDLLPLLVNGLRELADTYIREGAYDDALSHLEAGLEALGDVGRDHDVDIWLSLVERLAFVHMRQGKLDSAFALAHMGTTEIDLRKTNNLVAIADLYNTLGGIAWQQGNLDEAIFYVNQCLEPYVQLGYAWGTANAYSNLGVLHAQQGHWLKTLSFWEQALQIRRESGDYYRQAFSLANLAQLHLHMGDFDAAAENLQEAHAKFTRLGDSWGLAQVYATETEMALLQGELVHSAEAVDHALNLAQEIGSQDSLAHALSLKALVLVQQLELGDALETATQSLAIARSVGLPDVEADSARTLGVVYLASGNVQEAETSLRESLELYRQIKDPYRQGLVLLELGSLYQKLAKNTMPGQQGRYEKAHQLLKEAEGLFRKLGAAHDLKRLNERLEELQGEFSGFFAPPETAVPQPTLPYGERRKATILWAKLLVPPFSNEESAFTALASAISSISAIVQEHQGIMRQHPDGIEAIFGAPVAYEDDAEQAVRAAYYIVNHLQQANYELDLAIRIGISQGEVITSPATAHQREKLVILGQPLEQVQSIAAQVPLGKIWVTEAVQRISKRLFTYQPVAAPQALGLLWELSSLQTEPSPKRGLPDRPGRFVGRDTSMRQLLSLSLNLARGIGGWFLVEGEAGVGKSRLLHEFQVAIAKPGRQVWSGNCLAQRMNQPFHVFTELLNNVFQLQPTDSVEVVKEKVATVMRKWPQDAHSTLPYIEILLGLPPEGLEGSRLSALEPDQLRQQIFVAVRRLLKALARRMSMVLVFDDLHWVDPVSAELLFFLAPLITSDSILFVGAQRRQGADLPNERLIRLQTLLPGQTMHLMLQRLSAPDSTLLIQDLFGSSDLPEEVLTLILERSEGNPYFIEEFVRMFIENDYVELKNGRWQLNPTINLWKVELPSSLDALIRSRLDALPQELKEVLQCAAVIGRTFDAELLGAISNNSQINVDLRRLAARLMITAVEGSDRWQFSHALFESVVYASMLKKHRQQLHGRIAEILEQHWHNSLKEHTSELAHHFSQAGAPEKAIHYLLFIAEQAAASYANEEALNLFRQAAEIIAQNDIADAQYLWRKATGLGSVYRFMAQFDQSILALQELIPLIEQGAFDREQTSDVYWEFGQTLQYQGEFTPAYIYYQKALDALETIDSDSVKAKSARIFTSIAKVHWSLGELTKSLQACKRSLELAQESNNIGERAAVENLLGGIYLRQGNWSSALHHTTRAMVLREQMGYSWGVAASLSNLGILAVVAGHWHKAESFFKRSIALRQEMGDIEGVVIAQINLGNLLREQGDLAEAESYLNESLRTANTFNMRHHLAAVYDGMAEVLLLQNRLEEADEMVSAGIREAEHVGIQELLAYIYRVQAEVCLARGLYKKGETIALQAVSIAAELHNRSYEAAGWRVAAASCLHQQNFELAQEYLEKARALLADTTDELGNALITALAARLYLMLGQEEQAETELRAARNVFSRLGAKLYLKQLDTLQASFSV